LPNIVDVDVISAFLSGTTNKILVHKLERKSPRTTKELLNIATSHASSEEAVGVIFDCAHSKAKRDKDAGKGISNRSKNKNKPRSSDSLVAAAERKGKKASVEGTPDHFEKMLKGPCSNHAYLVKHTYKDCELMKKFLSGGSKQRDGKKPDPPKDGIEEKEDTFLEETGYLMIFGRPMAYDSKC
jgi:hypothetical protein